MSLNKEANFPSGSFFFLDQSEGLCGAKIKHNILKTQVLWNLSLSIFTIYISHLNNTSNTGVYLLSDTHKL